MLHGQILFSLYHIYASPFDFNTYNHIYIYIYVFAIFRAADKEIRRSRACGNNIVPTTTGSATAIAEIFPEMRGKLNGHAIRAPLANASITDCAFEMEREVTVEEINELFEKSSQEAPMKNILGYIVISQSTL